MLIKRRKNIPITADYNVRPFFNSLINRTLLRADDKNKNVRASPSCQIPLSLFTFCILSYLLGLLFLIFYSAKKTDIRLINFEKRNRGNPNMAETIIKPYCPKAYALIYPRFAISIKNFQLIRETQSVYYWTVKLCYWRKGIARTSCMAGYVLCSIRQFPMYQYRKGVQARKICFVLVCSVVVV